MLQEAISFHQRGQLCEAEALYRKVLAGAPEHPDALNLLGLIELEKRNYSEAKDLFGRAIKSQPDVAGFHFNLGNTFLHTGAYKDALACFDRAISIRPDYAYAHSNRGFALQSLMRFEVALASYDKAISIQPNYTHAHFNRASTLLDLTRFEEALASYDRTIETQPDYAEAYYCRGMARLLVGRYRDGWADWEFRNRLVGSTVLRNYPQPVWTGEQEIAGKTLYVHFRFPKNGFGEAIQFSRYLKLVEARGAKVVFTPQNSLRRLLRSLSPTVEILEWDATPQQFDYHIPLRSLPFAFMTDATNIPAEVPYLKAEPDRVQKWREGLGRHGFKIGVAWEGSDPRPEDGRSFPIGALQNISKLPVRLISLQKMERPLELPPGMKIEAPNGPFDAQPDAFIDTAAIMESLDLVISADTSVAHLAGALGRPTWIALRHVADWRWQLNRSDSPWYPTARLFRQTSRGDWASVFSEMESALKGLLRTR